MILDGIVKDMMPKIWPLLCFISLIAITLRGIYLFKGSRKVCFYKEILALIFIIYIICLYYLTIKGNYKEINFIPFKEIFKYKFGSAMFKNYVIENILLFIPFGFLSSYYLNSKKASQLLGSSLIISFGIEGIEYYLCHGFNIDDILLYVCGSFIGYLIYVAINAISSKLPRFMKSDAFLNILIVLIVILIVVFSFDINISKYL